MTSVSDQPPSAGSSSTASSEKSSRDTTAPVELDLARLAQKIYQLMQRELRLDRERRIKF